MAVDLSTLGGAGAQFFDNNGVPLAGGKLYSYAASTTTPKATFTSSSGNVPHTNPIILDSSGRVPSGGEIWLTSGEPYKFVLETSTGILLGTWDNIYGYTTGTADASFEVQTATAGQTLFVLNSMAYAPGTNTLGVYIDGVNQVVNNAYIETNATSVTFVSGLHEGAVVKFFKINIGAADANVVSYEPGFTGSVATTVADKLQQYVSVKDFGAVGNGVADDTAAIQAALDTGRSVYFPDGTYSVSSRLTVVNPNVQIYGPGIIKPSATWTGIGTTKSVLTIDAAASNVTISGLTFDSDDTIIGSQINFQIESFAPQTMVTNCRFLNSVMIGGASGSCVAFRTTSPYSQAIGNYTENTNGAIFVQGAKCVVANNTCVDPNDVGIVLNGPQCVGCVVSGNIIDNASFNSLSGGILVEEAANQWVIEGNTVFGLNNGIGIGAINVAVFTLARGGKIIGNVINGGSGTTTNPATFIYHNENYIDVEIASNSLFGCPTGNAASRMIVCAATGGAVHDNNIDGSTATGVAANVEISASGRGLTIQDNISRATATGRHFLFSAGSFGNVSCQFIGGRFLSGSEAINTATNAPTDIQVWLDNLIEVTSTNVVNMVAGMAWGERQDFLNTNSVEVWPHSIKSRTVMYGTAAPVAGAWLQGDTIYNLSPVGGSPPQGWVCTAGGSPGTWRAMASLI